MNRLTVTVSWESKQSPKRFSVLGVVLVLLPTVLKLVGWLLTMS